MRETCPWCKQPWDDEHREEAWIGEGWTWPVNYVYCPKHPRGRQPDGISPDPMTAALEMLLAAVESGASPERLQQAAKAARFLVGARLARPWSGKGG